MTGKRWRVGATRAYPLLFAWAAGVIGGAACSREACIPASPLPPSATSSANDDASAPTPADAFSAALSEFQGIVNLLGQTPPLADGDGLRRAIGRLAAALEMIPGPARPSRTEAVKLMRTRDFDVWISVIRNDGRADKVRETLEIAAGALTLTAAGAYASAPDVMSTAQRFRVAVDAIDASGSVGDERVRILAALREAVAALRAIQNAVPRLQSKDAGHKADHG